MAERAHSPAFARALFPAVFAVWLVIFVVQLWLQFDAIAVLALPDTDDAMRLAEVRDLMAGQSWFDTTQYRVNPPAGGLLHWSRLIDVQLAALAAVLTPFLGASVAERAAVATYPLVLLLPLLMLLALILRRLGDQTLLITGLVLAATSVNMLHYFAPMRIDHHNWQAILSVAMLWLALQPATRRNGMMAALVMALHLSISLEALPYLAILGGLFAWQWWRDPDRGAALIPFALGLAVAGPIILVATRGTGELTRAWCDGWTQPYMVATALGAGVVFAGDRWRAARASAARRLAVLGMAAMFAAAGLVIAEPACLAGPFGSLEPLVREFWYANVLEGRPITRQSLDTAAMLLAPTLVGVAATLAIWFQRRGEVDGAIWGRLTLICCATLLLSLGVVRTTAVAQIYALPGLAAAIIAVWNWGRARPRALARIGGSLAVLLFVPPVIGAVASAAAQRFTADNDVAPARPPRCFTPATLASLATMPPALVLGPIDAGPAVIVHTPHRVLATPHHRNHAAMNRVIQTWLAPPDVAETLVRRQGATLLISCARLPELDNYAKARPDGLAAWLQRGDVPPWLEPMPALSNGDQKIWRLRPVQAGTNTNAAPLMQ